MKLNIKFSPEDHAYTINGEKAISVTTLMKAVGLGQDYSKALEKTMELARDRGNYYDELTEEAIQMPFELTDWQERFLAFLKEHHIEITETQKLVGTLEPFAIAGMPDFSGLLTTGDFKATHLIYKNDVTWQTNIYTYLKDKENYEKYKCYVIHYSEKDDRFTYIELDRIPRENIEKVFECYQLGDLYSEVVAAEVVEENQIVNIKKFEKVLETVEEYKNKLSEEEKELKKFQNALMNEMAKKNIKTMNVGHYRITYTPPGKRTTVDNTAIISRHREIIFGIKAILEKKGIEITDGDILKEFKENPIDPEKLKVSEKMKEEFSKTTNVKGKLTITDTNPKEDKPKTKKKKIIEAD